MGGSNEFSLIYSNTMLGVLVILIFAENVASCLYIDVLHYSHIFVEFFTFLKIVWDSKGYNSALSGSNELPFDI